VAREHSQFEIPRRRASDGDRGQPAHSSLPRPVGLELRADRTSVAFPADEARRLVERFEWHFTPKPGSWLDMAESELGVLASPCLNRRIADQQILAHEVSAWQDHRNKHHAQAHGQFTTADARVKLKRRYPQFE
jgi:hypothetical protein